MSVQAMYSPIPDQQQLVPSQTQTTTYFDPSQQITNGAITPPPYSIRPIQNVNYMTPTPPHMSPSHAQPVVLVSSPLEASAGSISGNGIEHGTPYLAHGEVGTYAMSNNTGSRQHTPSDLNCMDMDLSTASTPAYFMGTNNLAANQLTPPGPSVEQIMRNHNSSPAKTPESYMMQPTSLPMAAPTYQQAQAQPMLTFTSSSGSHIRVTYPYSSARSNGSSSPPNGGTQRAQSFVRGEGREQSSGGGYKHTQNGVERVATPMLSKQDLAINGGGEHVQGLHRNSYNDLSGGDASTPTVQGNHLANTLNVTFPFSQSTNPSSPGLDSRSTPAPSNMSTSVPIPINISQPVVPGTGGNWDMRTSSLPGLIHSAGSVTSLSSSTATPLMCSASTRQTGFHPRLGYVDGVQDGMSTASTTNNLSLPGIASMSFGEAAYGGSQQHHHHQLSNHGQMFPMPPFQPLQVQYPAQLYTDHRLGGAQHSALAAAKDIQVKMEPAPTPQFSFSVPAPYTPQMQYQLVQQANRPSTQGNNGGSFYPNNGQYVSHATKFQPSQPSSNQPVMMQGYPIKNGHHFILAPVNQQAYSAPTFFVHPEQIQPGRFEIVQQGKDGISRLQSVPLNPHHAGYDSDDLDDKTWLDGESARKEETDDRARMSCSRSVPPIEDAKPSVQIIEPPTARALASRWSNVKRSSKSKLSVKIKPTSYPKKKQTPPSPRNHICPTCSKAFNRPSSLRTHMTSHTKEKPHHCRRNDCQQAFSVLSNLRRHERTHDRKAEEDQAALRKAARKGHTADFTDDEMQDQQGGLQSIDEEESDTVDDEEQAYRPGRQARRPSPSSAVRTRKRKQQHITYSAVQQHRHQSSPQATPTLSHANQSSRDVALKTTANQTYADNSSCHNQMGPPSYAPTGASNQVGYSTSNGFAFLPKPEMMRAELEYSSPIASYASPALSRGMVVSNGMNGFGGGQQIYQQQVQDGHYIQLPPIQNRMAQMA